MNAMPEEGISGPRLDGKHWAGSVAMNGFVMRHLGAWLSCLLLVGMAMQVARAATVEYIHTDALGSPVAVTNSAGAVVERREYEPYGRQLSPVAVADGPGFTGHVSDAATGLDYMQQRYYDPSVGRFLSIDPVTAISGTGANFNRYWYANNNPYRFTDPDGRMVGDPFRRLGSDDRIGQSTGKLCNGGHTCYGDGGSDAASAGKRKVEKAWRGIAVHKIIQADIALMLPGIEVKSEQRTLNPFSGNFGRVDLMLRSNSNSPWSVFEIKPGSQQLSSSLRAAVTSQLQRYVDSLNAEGKPAVVGNWSDFFGRAQNRIVNWPSMEVGGVDFGGSYLYGPSESERGVIYYSTGDPVGP
jgi:RHS repeat-associated protein